MNFSGISYEELKLPAEKQIAARDQAVMRSLRDPQAGGMPTIHELMHVAVKGFIEETAFPVGSDLHFAEAVALLAEDRDPSYKKSQYPGTAASSYWGERLNQACGYPSHLTHKMTNHRLYAPQVPIQKSLPGTLADE